MSRQVLDAKMADIAATGATIVATSNPGCTMQIETGLRRRATRRRGDPPHRAARPLVRGGRRRRAGRVSAIARAVVTGSTGFVGGHLAERLAGGGCAVTGLSNAPPRRPAARRRHGAPRRHPRRRRRRPRDGGCAARRGVPPRRAGVRPRLDARPGRRHRGQRDRQRATSRWLRRRRARGGSSSSRRAARCSASPTRFRRASARRSRRPRSTAPRRSPPSTSWARSAAISASNCPCCGPATSMAPARTRRANRASSAIFAERMLAGPRGHDLRRRQSAARLRLRRRRGRRRRCSPRPPSPRHARSGSGVGTSTLAIFRRLAALTGYDREPEFAPERPGDPAAIYLGPLARPRARWGLAGDDGAGRGLGGDGGVVPGAGVAPPCGAGSGARPRASSSPT